MSIDKLTAAYISARSRLLFFDYDGTLMEIAPTPPEAAPTAEVIELVSALANDPRNTIVIVSGRDRETLDAWLGDMPVAFAGEHGFWRKEPGQSWHEVVTVADTWRDPVRQLMTQYRDIYARTTIEEKPTGIGWHYRVAADGTAAAAAARQLADAIRTLQLQPTVRVIEGSMVVEVQPTGMDKGTAASHWIQKLQPDFILAAGDDVTDEDMLAAMPAGSFTIKVGTGASVAAMRLADPTALRRLLARLAASV